MAIHAPITADHTRTPIDELESISCWIAEVESIVQLALEDIEDPRQRAMGAIYGALSLLKMAGQHQSDTICTLMKERRERQ